MLGNDGLLETTTKKPVDVIQWKGPKHGGIQLEPSHSAIGNFMESYNLEMEHFMNVLTGKIQDRVSKDLSSNTNLL